MFNKMYIQNLCCQIISANFQIQLLSGRTLKNIILPPVSHFCQMDFEESQVCHMFLN